MNQLHHTEDTEQTYPDYHLSFTNECLSKRMNEIRERAFKPDEE